MEFGKIGDFLKRYENLIGTRENEVNVIIKVIHQITHLEVSNSQITLSKGTLTLKLNSNQRQQVFIYRDRIITELKLNNIAVSEIR